MPKYVLALASILSFVSLFAAQDTAPPRRSGLLATVESAKGKALLARREPRVAGTWLDGAAPHPSVDAERFRVRWRGELLVPRAATYRFSAEVRGRFTLSLGGKVVIAQEAADGLAGAGRELVTLTSDPIALEPGALALEAAFEKSATDARVQLCWQSEDFARVPIPASAFVVSEPADEAVQTLLVATERYEEGKLAFENQRCGSCHARSDAVSPLPAPDLTKIGSRVLEAWTFHWLGDPQSFRPGTEMPAMFAAGEAGAAERADVARYLASLGAGEKGPVMGSASGGAHTPNGKRGRELFAQRGCVACHDGPGFAMEGDHESRHEIVRMGPLGSKYGVDALASFLWDPKTHSARTMPSFMLSHEEALDLAAYLIGAREEAFEKPLPALAGNDTPEASRERGKKLVVEKGCLACHAIDGVPKVGVSAPSLENGLSEAKLAKSESLQCLSDSAAGTKSPRYAPSAERASIVGFLSVPAKEKLSAAPAYESARTFERFRCSACHARDGVGGELQGRQLALAKVTEGLELEQVGPPDLSGVGGKLRPDWMKKMFVDKARARPWLQVRMPHFGSPNVALLAMGFAAMDGEELTAPAPAPSEDPQVGLIGRDLIGRSGFACTSCHDLAGAEAKVAFVDARGPDLTLTPDRVRWPWFRSWLVDPQAMVAGTKMPTFFPGGKSTLAGRHGLDTEQQIRALYDYLSLGKKAPLPEGLRGAGGFSLVPEAIPEVVRTPFDDAPRSIAIGFPGGASIQFDGEKGMLRRVWLGGFLRMDGTQWTGDHGPYPKPEGRTMWEAAADQSGWSFAASTGATSDKPQFRGYSVKGQNLTFQTEFELAGSGKVKTEDRLVAAPAGSGLRLDHTQRILGFPADVRASRVLMAANAPEVRAGGREAVWRGPHGRSYWVRLEGDASARLEVMWVAPLSTLEVSEALVLKVGLESAPRDVELALLYGFDAPSEAKRLAEPWAAAKPTADPLAKAPLTRWFHEGERPQGDDPFGAERVHYEIERLPVPEGIVLQGGGCDFLPDGSLVVCSRRGEVWIVENATKEPSEHRWRRFARGLHEPLGLKVVKGELYVLQKPELTKIEDTDGDGEADRFTTVSNGWGMSTNFHEFAFGLETDRDGGFLGTLGLAIKPGGATREAQEFARGGAWKIRPDGQFEVLALGLRTPNGTGVDAEGRFYYTDNQGDYIPACKLQMVKKGEFYGQRFALPDREAKVEYTPATVWLPYGKVSHSASDVLLMDRGGKFGPFDGQLLVGDFTNSHLLRVQIEQIDGKDQGAVWIFRGGFASGLERFCWGPDGKLYCGESTGGWGAVGSSLFALERVSYTGKEPFEMLSIHHVKDGFELTFTKPLGASVEPKAALAAAEQFHYHYWATYGSPEIDREALKVRSVEISQDRRKVTLLLDGLKPDRIVEIKLRSVVDDSGQKLVHPEVWYTLNQMVR